MLILQRGFNRWVSHTNLTCVFWQVPALIERQKQEIDILAQSVPPQFCEAQLRHKNVIWLIEKKTGTACSLLSEAKEKKIWPRWCQKSLCLFDCTISRNYQSYTCTCSYEDCQIVGCCLNFREQFGVNQEIKFIYSNLGLEIDMHSFYRNIVFVFSSLKMCSDRFLKLKSTLNAGNTKWNDLKTYFWT